MECGSGAFGAAAFSGPACWPPNSCPSVASKPAKAQQAGSGEKGSVAGLPRAYSFRSKAAAPLPHSTTPGQEKCRNSSPSPGGRRLVLSRAKEWPASGAFSSRRGTGEGIFTPSQFQAGDSSKPVSAHAARFLISGSASISTGHLNIRVTSPIQDRVASHGQKATLAKLSRKLCVIACWFGLCAPVYVLVFPLAVCYPQPLKLERSSTGTISSLPEACRNQQISQRITSALKEVGAKPTAAGFDTLGDLYIQENLLTCAQASFEASLSVDGSYREARFKLAVLLLREGQASRTAKELESLIESTPTSFRAHYLLGLALQRMNQLNAAEGAFRAALEINPVSPEATYGLAQVLDREGRYSAEIHCLQQVPVADLSKEQAYRVQLVEATALAADNQFEPALSLLNKLASVWPDSIEIHSALASLYAHHERYRASAAEYKKVLELNPSNVLDLLTLSKVLLMGNQLQESVPYLMDYVKRKPNDAEGHEILGEALERLGQFGSAQKELLRSVDLNPANYKARYDLGVVLEKLGNHGQAIVQLQSAKRLNPGASEVYYELARIQAARKNSSAASRNLKAYERLKHHQQLERNVGNLNDLAVHFLSTQNWEAAANACRKAITLDPNKAEIHYNLSLALSHLGDTAAEQEELEKATTLNPSFAKAHNRLGLSYMRLGKLADAESEFKTAIQDDPEFSEAKNNLGVLYGREGKIGEAVEEFQEATLDEPQYGQAFLNWGLVLDSGQQYAGAEKVIRRAVQLSPDNAQGYIILGMTELELSHTGEAVAAYTKALALDPDQAAARLQLGIALAQQKHLEQALAEFSQAARSDPNSAVARYQEALVLYRLGRIQDARMEAEIACRLLPNYGDAIRLLALINRRDGSEATRR
jgi:tetratricopeptide (TPR) repeat protein